MIILDTDVLSAVIKPLPDVHVIDWLNDQSAAELFVTTITIFEILSGIAEMPNGRRRADLASSFERTVSDLLAARVLTFDEPAARVAADLHGSRRSDGVIVGPADTQIAGIAVSRGATLATRNVRHFSGLSVPVINPWEVP